MQRSEVTFKRIRLDIFPGVHNVAFAVVVRQETGSRVTSHLIRRGSIPYPETDKPLDGWDLLTAVQERCLRPA